MQAGRPGSPSASSRPGGWARWSGRPGPRPGITWSPRPGCPGPRSGGPPRCCPDVPLRAPDEVVRGSRPGPAGRAGRRAARAGPRAGRGRLLPARPDRGAHLRGARGVGAGPGDRARGAAAGPAPGDDVHRPGRGRGPAGRRAASGSPRPPATRPAWSVGEALVVEMGAEPVRIDEAGPPALPRRARARRQPPDHPGPGLRARPWSGPACTRPTGWSPRCCRRRWTTRCGTATARLTGPVARGDIETVRTHLRVLAADDPELAATYRVLAARTAGRAAAAGCCPSRRRRDRALLQRHREPSRRVVHLRSIAAPPHGAGDTVTSARTRERLRARGADRAPLAGRDRAGHPGAARRRAARWRWSRPWARCTRGTGS